MPRSTGSPSAHHPDTEHINEARSYMTDDERPIAPATPGERDRYRDRYQQCRELAGCLSKKPHLTMHQRLVLNRQPAEEEAETVNCRDGSELRLAIEPRDDWRES